MHAENAVVDEARERQVVEDFGAVAPHVDGPILAKAFVVKAVHLRDLPALVVPADQRNPLRVAHLEGEQEQEGFDGVESSVDEVAHEKVVRLGALTTHLEELHEVVELAVNVSADLRELEACQLL